MSFNWTSFDAAEEYKIAAAERRRRGLPTGKNAAGWQWKRPDAAKGTVDRLLSEVKSRWEFTRDDAIEEFRFAVYPDRYSADFVPF